MAKKTNTNNQRVTQSRPAHIDNGDEARGVTNARGNQNTKQPEPAVTLTGATPAGVAPKSAAIVDLDSMYLSRRGNGIRKSLLASASAAVEGKIAEKITVIQVAKQRLAEANDLYAEGDTKADEARTMSDQAALPLYQARRDDLLSAAELSSVLGDIFGFKQKGKGNLSPVPGAHPEASKTPFGKGEEIRKRIVRAAQAAEYVATKGEADVAMFEGVPVDMVAEVLDSIGAENGISLFTAFDKLAKLKDKSAAVEAAFDPQKVARFAETLAKAEAVNIFRSSPALQLAYANLVNILHVVDEAAVAANAADAKDTKASQAA